MTLIKQIITTLPFYSVPNSYTGATGLQTPFYFQKAQCLRDCFFGTITDREHLPPFIVRLPKSLGINYLTGFSFDLICPDGSNSIPIIPIYIGVGVAIITSTEKAILTSVPPTVGDKYIVDLEDGTFQNIEWTGGPSWLEGPIYTPSDNQLIKTTSDGMVYSWNGTSLAWEETNNGFFFCDIGDETLMIYNGFEVEDLSCGLKQIRFQFDNLPDIPSTPVWMSELVDIRDFDIEDNNFHKLIIHNDCNLGNIPYGTFRFDQWYYFDEDTGVGEPKYDTEQEKEEDGLGQERLIFSKTKKTFLLDTKLVPEYIVDFLTFVGMHDLITMTFPKETTNALTITSQYKGAREVDKDNYTSTPDWLDSACYATVKLLFGLLEDIIDTSCCQALDKDACLECSFNIIRFASYEDQAEIEGETPQIGDSYIIEGEVPIDPTGWAAHIGEIAVWNGEDWDYIFPNQNLLICNQDDELTYIYTDAEGWKEFLSLEFVSNTLSSITVKGYISSNSNAQVFYKKQTDIIWSLAFVKTAQELVSGVEITGLTNDSPYDLRLSVRTNNCDYGFGETIVAVTQLIESIHEWYRPNVTDIGTTITVIDTGSTGGMTMANPSPTSEPDLDANYILFNGIDEGVIKNTPDFRGGDTTGGMHFKINYSNTGIIEKIFTASDISTDDRWLEVAIRAVGDVQLIVNFGGANFNVLRSTTILSAGINTISVYCTGADIFMIINGVKELVYSLDDMSNRWFNYYMSSQGNNYTNIALGVRRRATPSFDISTFAYGCYSSHIDEATWLAQHNEVRLKAIPI